MRMQAVQLAAVNLSRITRPDFYVFVSLKCSRKCRSFNFLRKYHDSFRPKAFAKHVMFLYIINFWDEYFNIYIKHNYSECILLEKTWKIWNS